MSPIAHWPTAPASRTTDQPNASPCSPAEEPGRRRVATPSAFPEPARPRRTLAGGLETAANSSLALVLLLLGLPLLLGIAVAIYVTAGRPVLYSGIRLGRHRRPFRMYKCRTLICGASQIIGGQLLTRDHKLTISIGWFLRDTRLDELPQLVNILLGHMSFIGPRPERPEVYEYLCKNIPGYERRFAVKPGLIGYSQLFTPHNAPKRCRTLIDNWMVRKPHPLSDVFLIGYTAMVVLQSAASGLARYLYDDLLRSRILRRYREKRELSRVRPRSAVALVGLNGHTTHTRLVDINDAAFLVRSDVPLEPPYPHEFELRIALPGRNGHPRSRRAFCSGQVREVRSSAQGFEYVVAYQPASAASHYTLHQHFLKRSLAEPPFRRRGG